MHNTTITGMVGQSPLMLTPDDLSPTDELILDALADCPLTRGAIADAVGRDPNYVGQSLRRLREHGHVGYYHEESSMYELLNDPRTDA